MMPTRLMIKGKQLKFFKAVQNAGQNTGIIMKKWIFRLLVLVAVLGALALFGLQVASGTSDSHKRGLEQAFSQIFQGEASFGQLKTFNLFPQFSIEVEKLRIDRIKNSGSLSADHMLISFGPFDLIAKNRVIENFHLTHLKIDEAVFTPLALYLEDAGIYPNEKQDAARFILSGTYGAQELKAQFAMNMTSGFRPKYSFDKENEFTINLGPVQTSGLFNPYRENGAAMHQIKMTAQIKEGRIECQLPPEKTVELSAFLKNVLGEVSTIKSPADFTKLCETLKK